MLTTLLALAEPAAHAAEAGPLEGLKQTFTHFGVEPKYLVMQVVSFLILFGVLYKFGIKPTIATMEERNRKIGEGLKHAEEMKKNPDMEHDDPNAKRVPPQKNSEILWRFDKAGTFDFSCLIPGHREAGMTGTVIVK